MNTAYFNEKTGLFEVKFASKPNALIIRSLRELGFNWNARNGLWQLSRARTFKMEGGNMQPFDGFKAGVSYALGAAGLPDTFEAIKKQSDEHAHQAGVRGMEEANGIC